MSFQIKVGFFRRTVRPATWGDVATEALWMILALVCAFRFVPTIVDQTLITPTTGVFLSVAFSLVALLHALDVVRIARGLRKQKAAA